MSEHRADGRLFHGTELHNHVEVANVEFGNVKFVARVNSRREFRVDGSREEILALCDKLVVGQHALLTVAAEHLGNAYLPELRITDVANGISRITVRFVHAEVMPP